MTPTRTTCMVKLVIYCIPSYKESYVDHSTRMWLSFPPGTVEPSCCLNRIKIYIYFYASLIFCYT